MFFSHEDFITDLYDELTYEKIIMRLKNETLKLLSIVHIMAYICTYAMAFIAYNSIDVDMFEGSGCQSLTIYVLTMLGMAFTLSMLRYRQAKKGKLQVGELILVYDILQMFIMIISANKSLRMLEEIGITNDSINGMYSVFVLGMPIILSIILFITVVVDVALGILKKQKILVTQGNTVTKKKSTKSRINVMVIGVLVVTYIFSSFYAYGIYGLFIFVWIFLIAFPLPCGLFFYLIVKEWIENKKYIWAIGAYAIYMYLTYGVFHNLFNKNIYGYSSGRNAMRLFGVDGAIGIVNVIVGGIAELLLIIKALRKDRNIKL